MDFTRFDVLPEYAPFADEVGRFLDEVLTDELLAETRRRRDEHHPEFFAALGRRGWLLPDWPAEHGGADLDYRQIEILDTEIAKRSGPMLNVSTTRMTLPAIAKFARSPVREQVLQEVVRGDSAVVLGYTEPDGGSDIATVKTRATRNDDGSWTISGAKAFTSGAHHAKYAFLLAKSNPTAPKRKNLTMFVLPLRFPGVDVTPIYTLGERTNMLYLSDVVVGDEYRLGEVDDGWTVLSEPLTAEHGANGGIERSNGYIARLYSRRLAIALDTTIGWIRDPDTPLEESDPRVLAVVGEVARLVTHSTSSFDMIGRIAAAEALVRGSALLMDLIGQDALPLRSSQASVPQGVYQSAQASLTYGGSVEVIKNVLSRTLGLPPQRYAS